ncbi:hypothetical protein LguiA_034034 [Lonicera macranthoides]
MKLSLKLQQDQHHQNQKNPNQNPLLLRAKIPITVFGLPFLSGLVAADQHPSDLSLSLRTNFSSGPSLKLSYTPTSTTTAGATTAAAAPLTLTLRSGLSLSGSPNNSPLVISAHFSFSPQNPNPNPTFSLQFKPNFGDFSLRKTTLSNPSPSPNTNGSANSFEFVPLERPMTWNDFKVESATKDSILTGIAVMTKTALPVTKNVAVNLRWGVNFPADFGKQLPVLSVNKIKIERIDEVKEVKEKKKESEVRDLEMLKGMYSWMRREVNDLERENRELKNKLEEVKLRNPVKNNHGYGGGDQKKLPPQVVENSSGFEQWRKNKNGGDENGKKDFKKNVNVSTTSDVESELQRAIMAAST